VANHPAQHDTKADPHKAGAAPAYGPAPALFVAATPKDAPPAPTPMNVGDTGSAKVSFTDETQADVKIGSVEWTATGPVTITPPDPADQNPDPTTTKFTATGPGRASIKADIISEGGKPAEATTEIMVIEPGQPVTGKIDVTVTPAKKA